MNQDPLNRIQPPPPQPPQPRVLSYHTPQVDVSEAWEGLISPFAKGFVLVLLVVLFAGSILTVGLFFLSVLRGGLPL
jgi:hypothetical protein